MRRVLNSSKRLSLLLISEMKGSHSAGCSRQVEGQMLCLSNQEEEKQSLLQKLLSCVGVREGEPLYMGSVVDQRVTK